MSVTPTCLLGVSFASPLSTAQGAGGPGAGSLSDRHPAPRHPWVTRKTPGLAEVTLYRGSVQIPCNSRVLPLNPRAEGIQDAEPFL